MTALGFWNRFVSGETQALMTEFAPPTRICRRTIVRINNVTGRATARSIIARMIVGPKKSEQGIVQSRFLQTKKDRIGAIQRAKAAFGETAIRMTVRFFTVRLA